MTSRGTFLSAIVATALAGCAASDDRAGQFLVTPDRYVLYNCPQLAKAAQSTVSRQRKLEMLMAKAEVGFVRGTGQQDHLRAGICAAKRYDESVAQGRRR